MTKRFAEHKTLSLSAVNDEILAFWKEYDIFHATLSSRAGAAPFIFFEGPPSANGHPGIHHVMARTIKDLFCRYRTMKGYRVDRKAGWDTHGLPVELSVEKALGITKEDIGRSLSVEDYNKACRENVMTYLGEWTALSEKMGYFVDLDHPYITYETKYIETLWWLLKQLYDKGLLYKGYTIQPYSPAAGTGLSSHELNQPGCYRDVKDTTVTAQFAVRDAARLTAALAEERVYILAWTTTPWTLPSNTALCVGAKIDYVALRGTNPYTKEEAVYILAAARVPHYFPLPAGDEHTILWRGKGAALEGLHYAPLLPWIKPCALVDDTIVDRTAEAFRVILGDYVTTDDGTGIVHIAPTFGADDARVAREAGIPSLFVVDKAGDTRPMVDFQGKYFVREDMDSTFADAFVNDSYWAHSGQYVKNAYDPKYNVNGSYDEAAANKDADLNVALCIEMKAQGKAFKIEKHVHNYPHCWRTDKPVLYYPLDSWFVRSTACKERMVALNTTIKWKPASTGTGRFGKWLENLNDWNLSRSRFWGTPLPIWRNRDTHEELCIGSVEELYTEIERAVNAGVMATNPLREKGFIVGDMSEENYARIDLHRPYVDAIRLVGKSGSTLTRETDLIDVWFDSGAMPFAQIHYPFENKALVDEGKAFPADFISEGVDQTRGWFFTLHALATMVKDSVAFRTVVSNGLVLDKNGVKMSKRLGNVVDPFDCIGAYGADAVRWYMMTNAAPWDNLSFDVEGVREVSAAFFVKLFQAYAFFTLYANVDGFTYAEEEIPYAERPLFDRWILSELHSSIQQATTLLDDFEPTPAARLIQTFVVDKLSNWYIRLNKKRFWGGGMTRDKLSAYQTLYTCIETTARLIAPIAPFYADYLFRDLNTITCREDHVSVHLAAFPTAVATYIDKDLEEAMATAMQVTSMVLSLRKKVKIPVIQVLGTIAIPATDKLLRSRIERMKEIILAETNVKELTFIDSGAAVLVKKVKCNFRTMGKKYGKMMKGVAAAVDKLSQEEIALLERNGSCTIAVDATTAVVALSDVEIISEDIPGWTVTVDGAITVALDITITPALQVEGDARRLVKHIQNLRKASGLDIIDRITVVVSDCPESRNIVSHYGAHISSQVLANSLTLGDATAGVEIDMDSYKLTVQIEKA